MEERKRERGREKEKESTRGLEIEGVQNVYSKFQIIDIKICRPKCPLVCGVCA